MSGMISIVDIYALMCHLLGVSPAHHDGDFSNIEHILAGFASRNETKWNQLCDSSEPIREESRSGQQPGLSIGLCVLCIFMPIKTLLC